MSAQTIEGFAWEDGALILMARIRNADSSLMTQASITGITLKVFEMLDGSQVASPSIVVSSVVFDALQTPTLWTNYADSTGYNFRYDPAVACIPNGGRKYRFEFKFDPASGEDFFVIFEVSVKAVLSS